MGEKIKNMFRGHKEKKKKQNSGFSYMLASFIIHKRGWIESVFVIGCLLSLLTMNFVNVNYDLTKYLPETAESAIGLDVMRDKFGYPGTARVMVKDVSLYEAASGSSLRMASGSRGSEEERPRGPFRLPECVRRS